MADIALALLAHPDDAEILCAGTLSRLTRELGWQAHIATMTPGDCGSTELPPEEIGRIRRAEAADAGAVIGATYHCLEERDLRIVYHEPTLERATRLLRLVRPRIVLTHSPSDYLLDHEMTSTLARAAAFAAPVPNFMRDCIDAPPLESIPHLYYVDAIGGTDVLGQTIVPGFYIDISPVMEIKTQMLSRHASQREWLRRHHGVDEYLQAMRGWASQRGQQCGVPFAEGFRQHLGHGYPSTNLLGQLLGTLQPRPRTS